jgi:PAS domain S-box-containing protein
MLGRRLLGKFMLYYDLPHSFSEGEILIAQTVAAHVAFAIDQQEHEESERRYLQLLQSLGVAVYTTDAQGRITFFNEEAAALWGREPELGKDLWCGSWRLYHPDGTPMKHQDCPMAIALRERVPIRGREAIAERPDGSKVNFVPFPTPLFDSLGRLTGAVNVLVDITSRKRVEAALKEHQANLNIALREKEEIVAARDETIRASEIVQAQLASLIEASGALITSQHGEATLVAILGITSKLLSADAYAIWRYRKDAGVWEIMRAHGLSEQHTNASTIRDTEGPRRPGTMVVEDVQADEQLAAYRERYAIEGIRSIFVSPFAMHDDTAGTLTFYYREPHRFSDIEVRVGTALANLASASMRAADLFRETEEARASLQRANEELARTADELRVANRTKDEFLSLVSHELKTPLTTIQGNANLLFRYQDRIDETSRSTALSDIVAESERLHRIIENLLLLARAEQGQPLEAEPLLVVRIVRRVVERHRQHHPGRVFEIVEHSAPRPVIFSEASLEQVMENLVSNAEKYSPPNSPIVIEFDRQPTEVKMRVLDNGVGITQEEAENVFQPFYRSRASSGRAEGLGIGLAVCKRLVEAQGGRMWAKPRPEGGSEFGFALPITEEADADDL